MDITLRSSEIVQDASLFHEGMRGSKSERVQAYRIRAGLDNPNLPFFSEAYLYELVGKSDARTILSLLGSIARALGYEDGFWGMRRAERIAKEQSDER